MLDSTYILPSFGIEIDENLRSFLANKGFKTDHVMDHVELLSKIR